MIDIDTIELKLRKLGIVLDRNSIKLHSEQGWVNEVYIANSNRGRLIIHVGKHSDKGVQLQKPRRIFGLSKFLAEHPKIPSSNVLTYGRDSDGNPFNVQELIEGTKLSEIQEKVIHLKQLARILAYMHQIDVPRGGHIEFKTNQIQGKHKDWFTFLKRESYICLAKIYDARKKEDFSQERYLELRNRIRKFFSIYKKYFEDVKGKLLHGDIGLNNILIQGKQIVALLDLEWSCSGDPAWEFAGHQHIDEAFLKEYFSELKKLGASVDKDNFRFKIKLYWVIKSLFIANTFKRHNVFKQVMSEFEKELNEIL